MKLRDLKEAYKTGLKGKGFKDKSQDGENRIINFIFNDLKITPRYAVEFGAGQINNGGRVPLILIFFIKNIIANVYFLKLVNLNLSKAVKNFSL